MKCCISVVWHVCNKTTFFNKNLLVRLLAKCFMILTYTHAIWINLLPKYAFGYTNSWSITIHIIISFSLRAFAGTPAAWVGMQVVLDSPQRYAGRIISGRKSGSCDSKNCHLFWRTAIRNVTIDVPKKWRHQLCLFLPVRSQK